MLIRAGNGGWLRVDLDADDGPAPPGPVYVRVAVVDGRTRITEVYVDGRGRPVPAAALRAFPLGAVEEYLASSDYEVPDTPGPNLSALASHYATSWGTGTYQRRHCEHCDAPLRGRHDTALTDWVALSWFEQLYPDASVAHHKRPADRLPPLPLQELQLSAPEHGLTDDFLREVAHAYAAAVHRRLPPAKTLAAMTGVTNRTVQSWVYKARKRGLMPPAARTGRIT